MLPTLYQPSKVGPNLGEPPSITATFNKVTPLGNPVEKDALRGFLCGSRWKNILPYTHYEEIRLPPGQRKVKNLFVDEFKAALITREKKAFIIK